ncbi:hypothetical protein EG329_008195 [Mollisiaceae sp. DMI_Dod_QoI]|nr:hypothetical protein EG329_008195 [Helotiales sp. DMI_Dod_QoI]
MATTKPKNIVSGLWAPQERRAQEETGQEKVEMESQIPATTFTRFPALPDEIQLLIIRFAHLVPSIVEVEWPRYLPRATSGVPKFDESIIPCAKPSVLLQVSKKFREEGEKIRPLTLAMKESNKTYDARIRFNFDLDTLVLPTCYIKAPGLRSFSEQSKIQRLVFSYDVLESPVKWERADYFIACMKDLSETVEIIDRCLQQDYVSLAREPQFSGSGSQHLDLWWEFMEEETDNYGIHTRLFMGTTNRRRVQNSSVPTLKLIQHIKAGNSGS